MFDSFQKTRESAVAVYELETPEQAKRFGVISLDENNRIIDFEEKPENPKSKIISHSLYIFPKEFLKDIGEYMKTDLNKDGPGYLIKHFHKTRQMNGFLVNGEFFDIGIPEDYEKANDVWKEKGN